MRQAFVGGSVGGHGDLFVPPNVIRFGQRDPDGAVYDPPGASEVAEEGCEGGCVMGSGVGVPGALAVLRRRGA